MQLINCSWRHWVIDKSKDSSLVKVWDQYAHDTIQIGHHILVVIKKLNVYVWFFEGINQNVDKFGSINSE